MLPFHDGPVIRENIIMKILLASSSAKISYHKNFHVYGTIYRVYCSLLASKHSNRTHTYCTNDTLYMLCKVKLFLCILLDFTVMWSKPFTELVTGVTDYLYHISLTQVST